MEKRDRKLDCLKGIAISLVIVGHIMQHCFANHFETVLFNIIWVLQIPIFMLISGYLSKYNNNLPIIMAVKKKARNYIIPFVSCFVGGILLFHRSSGNFIVGLKHLVFHIEDSLWYLFVLFVLSICHIIACAISETIDKHKVNSLKLNVSYLFFFGLMLLPWCFTSVFIGTTFLGSKYILYYAVFFIMGQMWRRIGQMVSSCIYEKNSVGDLVNAGCILIFLYIMFNFELKYIADNLYGISIRFMASTAGCIILIQIVYRYYSQQGILSKFFTVIGRYTMEIYYIHYLLYWYIATTTAELFSVDGILTILVNYFALLLISLAVVKVVSLSPISDFIIFGKVNLEGKNAEIQAKITNKKNINGCKASNINSF